MMRLNLRKFHLLLAEWRLEQRFIENRWYRMYEITGGWETPPPPDAAFPFLTKVAVADGAAPSESTPELIDDTIVFQQVSAPFQFT